MDVLFFTVKKNVFNLFITWIPDCFDLGLAESIFSKLSFASNVTAEKPTPASEVHTRNKTDDVFLISQLVL